MTHNETSTTTKVPTENHHGRDDEARPRSAGTIALWALQILLGLFMIVASGVPKLLGVEAAAEGFDDIGWGDWFMYFIGAVEVAGGVGLLLKRWSGLAAIGLSLLMIGAAIFNATVLDYPVATPLVLLVGFVGIAYARRAETRALLHR